jgi:hypothetical protein
VSVLAVLAVLSACSSPAREPVPAPIVSIDAAIDAAIEAAAPPEPAQAPQTLDDALVTLRSRGFDVAADVIARRVAQRQPKMRLTGAEALSAALALLAIADHESVRALHAAMPRTTVELARAVRERDLALDEAEDIARYLARVVEALSFERLDAFDENHSHVTGRAWHEIDYTGERMTWQGQRDYWEPRGVTSFTRAAHIHAYFVGAEQLPHWKRVYRPRGRMAAVAAP